MGAGVGAVAEKTRHQRQSPQQELEPSVVTDGAGAATSATDRWIPVEKGPPAMKPFPAGVCRGNGGGVIHEGAAGPPGGAVAFTRTATGAAAPCDTSGYEIEMRSRKQPPGVLRTFTLLAAEEDIARTLAQPDAVFCDSEELAAGPAHLLETPEMHEQAHAGPYGRIWAKAERKEVEGLSAVGTFVEEGGM